MIMKTLIAIGPHFNVELRKSPRDPDGAWRRAVKRAKRAGRLAIGGWAVVPDRLLFGPIKQNAFEIFQIHGRPYQHQQHATLQ